MKTALKLKPGAGGVIAFFILAIVFLSVTGIVFVLINQRASKIINAAGPTVVVDFAKSLRDISSLTFGMDESSYGWVSAEGRSRGLAQDPAMQQQLKKLKVAQMRFNFGYERPGDPSSRIVCYAEGCDKSISALTWISAIKATGAEPEVEVQMNPGEQAYWESDAAAMVRYFNKTNNLNIKRWIVDNELDVQNKMDATTYSNGFNKVYDAMKAVDPTIKIGGPATSWYNRAYIDTFLAISGSRVDFVDYHNYGQGGSNVRTDEQLLAETTKYETDPQNLRDLIKLRVPTRADNIEIELGEWNLSWTGDGRMYSNLNTVWSASALGHMLRQGVISRQYASKNGSLGAVCQDANPTEGNMRYQCNVNDPTPVYHGMGMFTGESLFDGFGTKLVTSSTNSNVVEIFASDNPKNIVAVNKSKTLSEDTQFTLVGISSGNVDVWQKTNADSAPVKKTSLAIRDGVFNYQIPAFSVVTFLVKVGPVATVQPIVYNRCDLNRDGALNSVDQDLMASKVGKRVVGTDSAFYDLNGDKYINSGDQAILANGIIKYPTVTKYCY